MSFILLINSYSSGKLNAPNTSLQSIKTNNTKDLYLLKVTLTHTTNFIFKNIDKQHISSNKSIFNNIKAKTLAIEQKNKKFYCFEKNLYFRIVLNSIRLIGIYYIIAQNN